MRREQHVPKVAFSILLALSLKERHGYEIIKQIREDSEGKFTLGPGALYTSIKQLLARGLIVEVKKPDDKRRRYYKLSDAGRITLADELRYYQHAVMLAQHRRALTAMPNVSTI